MVLTFGSYSGGAQSFCRSRRGALPGLCANGREGSCQCLCSGARILCFLTVQQVMVAYACNEQPTQPEAREQLPYVRQGLSIYLALAHTHAAHQVQTSQTLCIRAMSFLSS